MIELPRSSYYFQAQEGDAALEDNELEELIGTSQDEFPGYGYHRVTHELRRRGQVVNHMFRGSPIGGRSTLERYPAPWRGLRPARQHQDLRFELAGDSATPISHHFRDSTVDRGAAGCIIAVPAQEAIALRLGNARLPRAIVARLQSLV
ncbi:hypothetical protein ACLF3G_23665 [Falsiroseomonas sp. HC035]|uniref:hypothetical protein n=1 Tax=Falsiroseomonas sp. HC035 TaxID=3390999 RepID=UPI003D321333